MLTYYDPELGAGHLAIGTTSAPNLLTVQGGIYLASTTPANTENALYNLGSNLYWNGTQLVLGDGDGVFATLTVTGTSTLANTLITDLTVSGTTTLAGDLLTNFATGSVTFIDADGLLTEDNQNFFYNASTTRLGIGTSTPISTLTVAGDVSIYDRMYAYGESFFDRLAVFNDALTIASSTPSATSSSLYNLANSLFWNGRTVDLAFEEVASTTVSTIIVGSFNLDNLTYVQDLTTGDDGTHRSMRFNNDGTKLFLLTDEAAGVIREYDVSDPYNVGTVSLSTTSTPLSEDVNPYDIEFNDTGTKLFMVGTEFGEVHEYDLSVAFDITTISYVRSASTTPVTDPQTVTFNDDGSKLYVADADGDTVNEYDLSTPYSLISMTFNQSTTTAVSGDIRGHQFNNDGTKMFLLGDGDSDLYEYDLSAPYDIATAAFLRSNDANDVSDATGMDFNASGTSVYIVDNGSEGFYEYSLTANVLQLQDIENSTELVYLDPAVGAGRLAIGTNTATSTLTVDGDVSILDRMYAYGESFFDRLTTFNDALVINSGTPSATSSALYNEDDDLYWNGRTVDLAFEEVAARASATPGSGFYDISTAALAGAVDVSDEDSSPSGVVFNNDGTKLFMTGTLTNSVHEYDLSVPYDVTTLTSSITTAFPPTGPFILSDLTFNAAGTKLYIVSDSPDAIYEFDLETAFDISSTTLVHSTSTAGQFSQTRTVNFNNDGTNMYVSGPSTGIATYALSSPYDVSTAAFATSSATILNEETDPEGLRFSVDGSKLFVTGSDSDMLHEYDLSPAFDVSTANFVQSTTTLTGNEPRGLAINDDGSSFYILTTSPAEVRQYDLAVVEASPEADIENSTELVYLDPEVGAGYFALGTSTATTTLTVDGGTTLYGELYALSEALFAQLTTFSDALTVVSSTPSATSSSIYNQDGTLFWSGLSVDTAFEQVEFTTDAIAGIDPYDLSTAVASNTAQVPGASFETGINFNDDGSKMFITAIFGDKLSEFDLSTPYDVTTLSLRDSTNLSEAASLYDVIFNDDGTKLYVIGSSGDAIY
ncbi:MAG: hypothetical protein AAFO91_01195, partial [Bacteroidota bacterium]